MLNTSMSGTAYTPFDAQRMLSKAVEFAPNGVALTDLEGHILFANAELTRMFGYAETQLLRRPIEDLIPERFRVGHARLRTDEGKDAHFLGAGRELSGRRADGTEFPIEIALSAIETPDGAVVVETIVDISVRKRLERMFQKMVEAAPCGMVMIDASGRIVLVNPQMEVLFGYAGPELIGAPLEMLLPERLREAHGKHRRAFAAAPTIRQMGVGRDLTARRKDGSEFPVEIGLNPVAGDDGGLVLAAVTDITLRKSMELELQQANANLEEFTYAASHDLKSPLRGISDLIEWIEEDIGTSASPEVTRNLGRVSTRIQRLEQIIDDLLKYARAGTRSVEAVTVDPRALLTEILEIQTMPPGLRINTQVDAAPFVTSKTPLATALRNIISNAVKHHDLPNGSVELRVEEVDRYCVFTVSDDGPGIPEAAQQRVFRMFQVLAPAGRGGAGIGLALSKRLVESHGGRITLASRDGVRGTTFQIWWPRLLRTHEP
ncbi:MAG TPA: PAS domain-containing sensor histidine kinase [Steroidobacteraceae bacterium]